jgi:hypothetical protein
MARNEDVAIDAEQRKREVTLPGRELGLDDDRDTGGD